MISGPDTHVPGAPEVYLISGAYHQQQVAADPCSLQAGRWSWEGKAEKGLQDEAEGVRNYHPTPSLPWPNFSLLV